mgnify:CR=1 FL=1
MFGAGLLMYQVRCVMGDGTGMDDVCINVGFLVFFKQKTAYEI